MFNGMQLIFIPIKLKIYISVVDVKIFLYDFINYSDFEGSRLLWERLLQLVICNMI